MGDIAEDMAEALHVIDAYVDARIALAEAETSHHSTRSDPLGPVPELDSAISLRRKEMEETLRALLDPRMRVGNKHR